MTDDKIPVVAVTGPTATGKTALAVALARRFNGEVVSVDSRQVYRHLDIGSGKDLAEYGEVPCHLIDIADPGREVYNLWRFCGDAAAAIADIRGRGRLPVLCGGTALYLAALLDGYELPGGALPPRENGRPRSIQCRELPPSRREPLPLKPLIIGVLYPRAEVRRRIEMRLDARLAAGMIEEVRELHDRYGVSWEQLEYFGLEYREVAALLQGRYGSAGEMRDKLLDRIRQFAKRQDIFFRKIEREGHLIYWIPEGDHEKAAGLTAAFLGGEPLPEVTFRLCDHRN